jgi:hypothetical protein
MRKARQIGGPFLFDETFSESTMSERRWGVTKSARRQVITVQP